MGSVDLPDGLFSFRIPVKSKKWYHSLIWHFLDITVVQGCILQKRDTGNANLNLKAFKTSAAMPLMKKGTSTTVKRGRPSLVIEKTYESKKSKRTNYPYTQCFNSYGSLRPFSCLF